MNLKELKLKVDEIISDLKNNGRYPKENDLVDYKTALNVKPGDNETEVFMKILQKISCPFQMRKEELSSSELKKIEPQEYTMI